MANPSSTAHPVPPSPPQRVLVVEDLEDTRTSLQELLQLSLSLEVDTAEDGAKGLELLRSRHATGETRFDFGIGSSRQKSDFAATEHPLYNLTAATSIKGSLVSLIYNRAKPMKTMLRRRFASIR